MPNQKVYVTGATGFIGGKLVKLLVDHGKEVTCLVRSPERVKHLEPLGIHVVTGDITDRECVARTVPNHATVFHIAAWYEIGVPPEKESAMRRTNVTGTKIVLEESHKSGADRIVYCSTVGALGSSGSADQTVDETHPHDGNFQCLYVKTKYEAHLAAKELAREGAPIVTVLPGAVYGPGDSSLFATQMQLIRKQKVPAIPRADGVYSYTHVDDVVSGIWLAAEKGRVGEQYILAGPALTLEQFHLAVAEHAGVTLPKMRIPLGMLRILAWISENIPGGNIVTGGLPLSREAVAMMLETNWAFSSEKAARELGWNARSFQDGLVDTMEWIQKGE